MDEDNPPNNDLPDDNDIRIENDESDSDQEEEIMLALEDSSASSDDDDYDDSSSDSSVVLIDDDDDAIELRDLNFDTQLPGTHAYLGDNLEEVHRHIIHEDETRIKIKLLVVPDILLVPGQIIPLLIHLPRNVELMRGVVESGELFGMVRTWNTVNENPDEFTFLGNVDSRRHLRIAKIGTTAEILQVKVDDDPDSGIAALRAKVIGRQRFIVLDTNFNSDGELVGTVCIKSEQIILDPLYYARPHSKRKLIFAFKNSSVPSTSLPSNVKYKINSLSDSIYAAFPSWLYKLYDPEYLMERIKLELIRGWNIPLTSVPSTKDPVNFSFWLAANLPFSIQLKMRILHLDSTVQRLRFALSLMQKCSKLACSSCDVEISEKKHVFSMAVEGPMIAYVNPGGSIYETITLTKAQNLRLTGPPSTENSWFPGYAWTIASCNGCLSHMGWRFTAVSKDLKPQKFWGLTRSALIPRVGTHIEEPHEQPQQNALSSHHTSDHLRDSSITIEDVSNVGGENSESEVSESLITSTIDVGGIDTLHDLARSRSSSVTSPRITANAAITNATNRSGTTRVLRVDTTHEEESSSLSETGDDNADVSRRNPRGTTYSHDDDISDFWTPIM